MTRKLVYYPNRKEWQVNGNISKEKSDDLQKFLEEFKNLDKKKKSEWNE